MKKVGLVFLGFIASVIAAALACLLASVIFPNVRGEVEVPLIVMFVIIPIGFFIGSSVTGFLGYNEMDDRSDFLWMSPALYCDLIVAVVFLSNLLACANTSYPLFWRGVWVFIAIGVWWYIVSLAGIELGYNIRERLD